MAYTCSRLDIFKVTAMNSGRLQAFSDGVLAITITILVFNLKPPEFTNWESLLPLVPEFIAHILTFIYVAIYWNNHHHLWHAASKVSGKILWANSHLLFWLSILPMASGWVGKHFLSPYPMTFNQLVAGSTKCDHRSILDAAAQRRRPEGVTTTQRLL